MKDTRAKIFECIDELVDNLTTFDRWRNDSDLSEEDFKKALNDAEIGIKEMSDYFQELLVIYYIKLQSERLNSL